MAISEQDRHELHGTLEQVLGRGQAATLMAYLPPVGSADVATKRDLDVLGERLETKIEGVETRIEGLDASVGTRIEACEHRLMAALHRELNIQMRVTVVALLATASVTIAAVRL